MLKEMQGRSTPVNDPAMHQFVTRVVQRLGIPEQSVTILQTLDFREPTGLPGGYVVIPSTVCRVAQDEDEFAGLLAHAFAHSEVELGRASKTADVPVVFYGGWNGVHVDTANRKSSFLPISHIERVRAAELAADARAIEQLHRAGYDASAYRHYVARVQPADTGKTDPLPARDLRLAAMDSLLTQLPAALSPAPRDIDGFRAIQASVQEPHRTAPTLRRKQEQ